MTNPKWEIGPVKLVGGREAIIDAIDAEIEAIKAKGAILCRDAYINGLRFARALIVKRMEASK